MKQLSYFPFIDWMIISSLTEQDSLKNRGAADTMFGV